MAGTEFVPQVTGDHVQSVHLYAVKGLHEAQVDGQLPDRLDVGDFGLEAYGVSDRSHLLAEPHPDSGELWFVSQRGWLPGTKKREHKGDTKLATVQTNVWQEGGEVGLTFSAPGFGELALPVDSGLVAEPEPVHVHSSMVHAFRRPEANEFFSDILGREVQFMQLDHSRPRATSDKRSRDGAMNKVGAADSSPLTLASLASRARLAHLNGVEPGSVPLSCYRANVVVDGHQLEALAPADRDPAQLGEDYIKYVRLGATGAYGVGGSSRCLVPNHDQDTGSYSGASAHLLRGRTGFAVINGVLTDTPERYFCQNLNLDKSLPGAPQRSVGSGDAVVYQLNAQPNVRLKSAA